MNIQFRRPNINRTPPQGAVRDGIMSSEQASASHQRPTRPKAWRGFLRSESKSYDRTIVGRRVRVYWESDRVWYQGVVKDYDRAGELHTVCYDDGDQRDEPLNFKGANQPDGTIVQWELVLTEASQAGIGVGASGKRRAVASARRTWVDRETRASDDSAADESDREEEPTSGFEDEDEARTPPGTPRPDRGAEAAAAAAPAPLWAVGLTMDPGTTAAERSAAAIAQAAAEGVELLRSLPNRPSNTGYRYVSKYKDSGKFHGLVQDSSGNPCDLGTFETAEEASLAAARFLAGDRVFFNSWKHRDHRSKLLNKGCNGSCVHCGRVIPNAGNLRLHQERCGGAGSKAHSKGGGTAAADAAAAAGGSSRVAGVGQQQQQQQQQQHTGDLQAWWDREADRSLGHVTLSTYPSIYLSIHRSTRWVTAFRCSGC